MKSVTRSLIGMAALVLGFCLTDSMCHSQGFNPATSIGAPQSVLHGGQFDKVDLKSGNLGISIPLLHLAGRGLDTDIVFTLNSKQWTTDYSIDIYGNVSENEIYAGSVITALSRTPL